MRSIESIALAIFVATLAVPACSSQATRARGASSAKYLGCAYDAVDVSNQTDNTWTAACGGKKVNCIAHGNDIQCTPDPPPPTDKASP